MALCPFAVQKILKPDALDPLIDPDLAVLHVDAGNASSLYDWWVKNGTLECHFFVKKDGGIEQYVDTKWQADAQVGGGSKAISIETQGYGSGEWTDAQMASIKRLLTWIHEKHPKVKLRPPANPYDAGIGYHSMWPSSQAGTWAKDGRTCPGPDRIKQYKSVLVPWMSDPTQEDDMTPEELLNTRLPKSSGGTDTVGGMLADAQIYGYRANRALAQTNASLAALSETVGVLAKSVGVDPGEIVATVDRAVRDRLSQISVVDKEPSA